jgi:hypothetical protein
MSDTQLIIAFSALVVTVLCVAFAKWMQRPTNTPLLETQDPQTVIPWIDPASKVAISQPAAPASLDPTMTNGRPSWSDAQLEVLIPIHFGAGAGLDLLSEFVRPRTFGYLTTNREMPWDEYLSFPLTDAMVMLIQARMIKAPQTENPEEMRWRLTVKGATYVASLTDDPAICNAARKLL